MTSKWPLIDLKWIFWALGLVICLFIDFLDAESIAPIRFAFQVTKWPLNDLKWPVVTWKHNFLTKSHFWACIVFFYVFLWGFGTLRHIKLLRFKFRVTKWPILTSEDYFLTSKSQSSIWTFLSNEPCTKWVSLKLPLEIYICFTYALGVFLDNIGMSYVLRGFQGHIFYLMDSILTDSNQWISCWTKKKVSLYLYIKCQKQPEVNFGTLYEVNMRSFWKKKK